MARLVTTVLLVIVLGCSAEEPSATSLTRPNPGTPSETPLPNAWHIEFTEDGFSPDRLDIDVGQQVVFTNRSDIPLWPASNIHPTHKILTEFDSGVSVGQGETWAYTFKRPGFWRYHNHVAPEHGGLVIAYGDQEGQAPEALTVDISNLNFKQAPELTPKVLTDLFNSDVLLRRYVEEYGPATTVTLVAEAGDVVDKLCHERAHETGRIAYDLFGAAAFALAGHECEAGAYHGATEAMFKERGTINLESDVEIICGSTDVPFFRLQCIHGVGHGLMAWTSYELYNALELCDRLATDRDQRACYSGVFMENVVGGLSGAMGHYTDYLSKDDPHYPCNALTERYIGPCYLYHSTRMLIMFEYDYKRVGAECANARETARYDCFESFGRDLAALTLGDPALGIQSCHETVADVQYRVWCIQGSVQARFWETANAPEAVEMCTIAEVAEEKNGCYWMIISRARELYPDQPSLERFCASLESAYRAWCARE